MSQKKLIALVEALRQAGQIQDRACCMLGTTEHCECLMCRHNAATDKAAKALVAEVEERERHLLLKLSIAVGSLEQIERHKVAGQQSLAASTARGALKQLEKMA